MVQQVGRESMAQGVWRQVAIDAGLAGIGLDDVPEGLAGHTVAATGRKQEIRAAVEQDVAACTVDEILEPAHRYLAERDQTLAIALAQHPHHTLIEVDLAEF